jgi:hypothetical protein
MAGNGMGPVDRDMNDAKTRECTECGFEYYGRRERCTDCSGVA